MRLILCCMVLLGGRPWGTSCGKTWENAFRRGEEQRMGRILSFSYFLDKWCPIFEVIKLTKLRVRQRSFVSYGLKRGEGDFVEVFCECVCVCTGTMHNSSIKEPRASQRDVACIHGHNITPNLILVVLTNWQSKETMRSDLQAFTLIKPLSSVWAWMWWNRGLEFLH